ncbi:MAG TPA: lipid hydroperoxide peroxidase, partial [bacterium]|nr:lipid hydroperoxide peroxidase [bacterium]
MRQVKFKNNILNIVGRNIKVYDFAPDFRVVSSEMKDIFLNQFDEKIKIITTFPSLDTSVCDLQ